MGVSDRGFCKWPNYSLIKLLTIDSLHIPNRTSLPDVSGGKKNKKPSSLMFDVFVGAWVHQ